MAGDGEAVVYPHGWPEQLKDIHAILDDCLKGIIEDGYVYYFSFQAQCIHVSILPKHETFSCPGAIRRVDDMEMDRIISSCGALSFLSFSGTILVFSQKRTGIKQIHKCRESKPPQRDDILRFLHKHTGMAIFDREK